MRKIELTSEIWQEGKMYSAYCHELDVATAGRTVDEARKNLAEALEIFIEETARKGTLQGLLEEAGFLVGEAPDAEIILSNRSKFCIMEKLQIPVGTL
ncbi:MAG: hypothetical protein Q8R28_01970 [Dehalococcoidia bacterium]|nr:hypothetical protein [Dehalococcoidia bacterium]